MEINSYLQTLTEGLPPVPKQYRLRCHPDVFLALQDASMRQQAAEYTPPGSLATGTAALYGSAEVITTTELGSGSWELYEDGELLKRGRLGEPSDP